MNVSMWCLLEHPDQEDSEHHNDSWPPTEGQNEMHTDGLSKLSQILEYQVGKA